LHAQHRLEQGTSMAAPHITGLIALLASGWDLEGGAQVGNENTRDKVMSTLLDTAKRDAQTGGNANLSSWDASWGWGKVNAYHAAAAGTAPKWQQVTLAGNPGVAQVMMSPAFATDHTAFALTTTGQVFRSTNAHLTGGGTWTLLALPATAPAGSFATALAPHPGFAFGGANQRLFLALATSPTSAPTLWVSTTGGTTWPAAAVTVTTTPVTTLLPIKTIAPAPTTGTTLFITTGTTGLWRTANGASNTAMTFTRVLNQDVETFFVSPRFSAEGTTALLLAWVPGVGLRRSGNGNAAAPTWTTLAAVIPSGPIAANTAGLPSYIGTTGKVSAITASPPVTNGGVTTLTIVATGGDPAGSPNFIATSAYASNTLAANGNTWSSSNVEMVGACSGGCAASGATNVNSTVAVSPAYAKEAKVFVGQDPSISAPDPTQDQGPSGGVLKAFRDPFNNVVWAGGGSEHKIARTPPTTPPVLPLVVNSLGISSAWPNDSILFAGTPSGLFWDPLGSEGGAGLSIPIRTESGVTGVAGAAAHAKAADQRATTKRAGKRAGAAPIQKRRAIVAGR
jgi:hypothetical protein